MTLCSMTLQRGWVRSAPCAWIPVLGARSPARPPRACAPAPGRCNMVPVVAARTGVERRRMYDVLNVLESVNVVSRKGKGRYIWHGMHRVAQEVNVLRITRVIPKQTHGGGQLGNLSKRFIQLVLASPDEWLPIDVAGEALTAETGRGKLPPPPETSGSDGEDSHRPAPSPGLPLFAARGQLPPRLYANPNREPRTATAQRNKRHRRLYDIANILTSLRLIVQSRVGGKVAFQWNLALFPLGAPLASPAAR